MTNEQLLHLEKHGIEVLSAEMFNNIIDSEFWERFVTNFGGKGLNRTVKLLNIVIPTEKFFDFVKENPDFHVENLNDEFDYSQLLIEGANEIEKGMEFEMFYIKDNNELILYSIY